MAIDKRINYEMQGGVKNYRPSEMVTAPRIAKSSPDTPTAKLAYITPEEEKILVDLNLYGSLKGKPNRGPSGIPSLEGDFGPGGEDFGGFKGGADIQSAEKGDFRGFEGTRNLPPGVQPKPSDEAQALRNAFIASGGGQRINPGFFDSRDRISPAELALAKAYNPKAFRKTRGGGIMDFFTGGGFLGNIIRSLGQKFGLGKTYDQPTYDMSQFSGIGLLADRINPTFQNDLNNQLLEQLAEEDDEYERDLSQIGQDATFMGYSFEDLDKLKSGQKQYMPGENIAYGLERIFNRR